MNSDKMLYFGYGSNLDLEDLTAWCIKNGQPYPLGTCRGRGYLPDHQLAFTRRAQSRNGGVLDVVQQVGSFVPGVLFEVDRELLAVLDQKEGLPHAYRQMSCVILKEDGTEVQAMTYEVVKKEPNHQQPSEEYLRVVRQGYKEHGLDLIYLSAASQGKDSPTPPLFVYGTLKRGFLRHDLLAGMTSYVCTGWSSGCLHDLGAYPGMVLDGSNNSIQGELYHVADRAELFRLLDRVEGMTGFGSPRRLFRRALVRVHGEWSDQLSWTYVLDEEKGGPIASGEWARTQESPPEVTREWITALRQEVSSSLYRQATTYAPREWGGAGVVVTSRKQEMPDPSDFYGSPEWIEYTKPQEAAWLMYALKVAFHTHLDHLNKNEFYGRLAQSLSVRDHSAKGTAHGEPLMEMLNVAEIMLKELEAGSFGLAFRPEASASSPN